MTGVPILDTALGQMELGMPLVLCGPMGCGRTVLAVQLAHAAVSRGERVVFVTTEPPAVLLRQAESLELDLQDAIDDERLVLLRLTPDASVSLRSHGALSFVEALREQAPHAALVIFDPLNALVAEFLDEQPLRIALSTLFEGEDGQQQIVVTAESSVLESQPTLARALSDLCGALVYLGRNDRGHRYLEVQKSRFGAATTEKLGFSIQPGGVLMRAPVEETAAELEQRPSPRRAPPPASTKARRRVLVVDADRDDREQIAGWIAESYEIIQAGSGFAALSALLSEQPDMIVIDPIVPDVSGFDLLVALRKAPVQVPILTVSRVMARSANRVRALILGAADVISKPPSRLELRRKVDLLIQLPPTLREDAGEDPDVIQLASSPSREVDLEEFQRRLETSVEFGSAYELTCTLARVRCEDEDALDLLIAAAQETLRSEDAVLRIDETSLAMLLIAAEPQQADAVLTRMIARASAKEALEERVLERVLVSIEEKLLEMDWMFGPLGGDTGRPR